ncbi:MAG: DEAD/DEAH box helicase [Deltaproteobacteria bacterium]|nr:DEAD/DEAH box helicase [Deltaproteobacteria bacterium]
MKNFTELDLNPALKRAIADLKYEIPTPIQAQALPILLGKPTDFIGLAATGTGKTAAFSIPLLERIDPSLRKLQGLVLCPTRELAMQVSGQITLMGKHLGIRALPIYGGSEYGNQISGLKAGISVVVGTPGRLVDHINRGTLKLGDLKALILDEADEMISMGFKDDLEAILKAAPHKENNIWLFSATMSRDVRRVADTYLKNPVTVQVNKKEMLSNTVEQIYYSTNESNKPEVLCKLIDIAEDFYGLVFCQTKSLVIDLTSFLNERGYKVDCLHGDKDQKSRERTMQSYRDRRVSILICTDVASRGLDVKDVTHVINYSLPRELDSYVHRIGRTARSGKPGFAMSLVAPMNRHLIPRIEKMTNSRMREGKIPSGKDIFKKKIKKILSEFNNQKTFTRAMEMMEDTWKTETEHMTKEEIIGRFLVMGFPAMFEGAKEAPPQQRTPPRRDFKHDTRPSHKHASGGGHRHHKRRG